MRPILQICALALALASYEGRGATLILRSEPGPEAEYTDDYDGDGWTYAQEEAAGTNPFYADSSVTGGFVHAMSVCVSVESQPQPQELPVVCEDEELDESGKELIRSNARLAFEDKSDAASLQKKALYESATMLRVTGPENLVTTVAAMGITPAFASSLDGDGALALTYVKPTLRIIAFDHKAGTLRFKVTPGEGNAIDGSIEEGCVRVYGTDKLANPMAFVEGTTVDLTPYLETDTRGEGTVTVVMGTRAFLMMKIEKAVE